MLVVIASVCRLLNLTDLVREVNHNKTMRPPRSSTSKILVNYLRREEPQHWLWKGWSNSGLENIHIIHQEMKRLQVDMMEGVEMGWPETWQITVDGHRFHYSGD